MYGYDVEITKLLNSYKNIHSTYDKKTYFLNVLRLSCDIISPKWLDQF